LQTLQLQFHCGKPPPAAAPRIKVERRPMRRLSFLESLSDSLAGAESGSALIRTQPADSR
jgi:hypothetical protein